MGLLAAANGVSAQSVRSGWSELDRLVESAITSHVTPGLQLCVRGPDGELFSKGYGSANLEAGTAVTADSVFRIGSVTKEFTAVALLRLADQGLLSLEDPLDRHLPAAGAMGKITLAQLMSHTSGLNNYTAAQTAEEYLRNARLDRSTSEMVEIVARTTPLFLFEPGTDWAYSNSGYVLLGAVIESLRGLPLPEAFQDLVLGPLSLSRSAVDDAANVVSGRAAGYVADTEAPEAFLNAPFAAMSYAGASGSMRSTASDLCRWRSALLSGQVLSADALKVMLSPVRLSNGAAPVTKSADGRESQIRYGGGLYLDPVRGRPAMRGGGGIQGFVAVCDSLIDTRVTWSVLMNVDGNGATGLGELLGGVQRTILRTIGE